MALYVPGTNETDPKKLIRSQQLVASQTSTNTTDIATANTNIATNTAAIATLNSASYVNSIAGNSGAFTLNSTSGITNATNDIKLSQASASQFGAVKVDGTTITATGGVISATASSLSSITNSLGSDVALNNTASYFTGPSVAQGTTGTWLATGTVTLVDTGGTATFNIKLWDGTTIISSAHSFTVGASEFITVSLSGIITSPAGNIRISCQDTSLTTGKILFNGSGNSKDSTLTAVRIA